MYPRGHIPTGHKIYNSHRLFRHVAVPLIAGRLMSPEKKVIPKTGFRPAKCNALLDVEVLAGSSGLIEL